MAADRLEITVDDVAMVLSASVCDMVSTAGRNLQNRFDNTGKILVSQQSKEIHLELLSWDMKLLSQIQRDNIITGGLGVTGGFFNRS